VLIGQESLATEQSIFNILVDVCRMVCIQLPETKSPVLAPGVQYHASAVAYAVHKAMPCADGGWHSGSSSPVLHFANPANQGTFHRQNSAAGRP
jgi:hypothetical protein